MSTPISVLEGRLLRAALHVLSLNLEEATYANSAADAENASDELLRAARVLVGATAARANGRRLKINNPAVNTVGADPDGQPLPNRVSPELAAQVSAAISDELFLGADNVVQRAWDAYVNAVGNFDFQLANYPVDEGPLNEDGAVWACGQVFGAAKVLEALTGRGFTARLVPARVSAVAERFQV